MFKKIASLVLAATMMVGTAMFTTSAAEVAAEESAAVSADDSSAVGAESDSEAVGAKNTLTFDTTTSSWKTFKKVYCYIWEYGGDSFFDWGGRKTMCADNGDGTYSYDLDKAGISLESGKTYAVIFSNDSGMQTYDLILGTECIGKTAYCDGTMYENPVDSTKTSEAAFWKGMDKTKYGPVKQVTSIGNVVGTCIPGTKTAYGMMVDFLKNNLVNAQGFSGKDDQTLVDDTAKALGLYQSDVEKAIKEAGVEVKWSADKSSLDGGSNAAANSSPAGNNSGSSNNNSNNNNNSTGSVKSGVETTIVFVCGGLMLAAAGMAFLARKKREE